MHPFALIQIPPGHVGIHWFEQAGYAVKNSHGTITLIDPYFPHERPLEKFIHALPPIDESRFPVDHILFTHAHNDHTCSETVGRIHQNWPEAEYIGPNESIEKIIRESKVDPKLTCTVTAGDSLQIDSISVHTVLSKPLKGDPEAGIEPSAVLHLGYVVKTEGVALYFTGDEISTFADIDDLIRPVVLLKPDIGFITTHPTEGEFPTTEGSIELAGKIGLKTAVPSHYDCFVKRTLDPEEWADRFPPGKPEPLIIPYNSHIIYP